MIHYLQGDVTCPQASGSKLITHIVNTQNKWGAGVVLAISARWQEPEQAYRDWYKSKDFILGNVQFVKVRKDIVVVNMLAQEGTRSRSNPVPVRFKALETCLHKVADFIGKDKISVHMPRIGCGLGGASWDKIEPIVSATLQNIDVFVYDF